MQETLRLKDLVIKQVDVLPFFPILEFVEITLNKYTAQKSEEFCRISIENTIHSQVEIIKTLHQGNLYIQNLSMGRRI